MPLSTRSYIKRPKALPRPKPLVPQEKPQPMSEPIETRYEYGLVSDQTASNFNNALQEACKLGWWPDGDLIVAPLDTGCVWSQRMKRLKRPIEPEVPLVLESEEVKYNPLAPDDSKLK